MRTISSDPEIIVFSVEVLDKPVADLNVDVEVRREDGRWSASFFTLENIESLMNAHAQTGECAGGLYEWAADMILVSELSDDVIRRTVAQLQSDDDFEAAFAFLGDEL